MLIEELKKRMKKRVGLVLMGLAISGGVMAQPNPLVKNVSRGDFPKGLSGKHIAVWHSHGYYYEASLDRWEWQRAKTFGNVEDIGNMPYVVKYLTPMLENAGAVVLNPRERDIQRNSFIVDNDRSSSKSSTLKLLGTWKSILGGYKYSSTLKEHENPFQEGSYLQVKASKKESATLTYMPNIPNAKKGEYAVYVSWANNAKNVSDVTYKVYHTGGVSEFIVNQKMYGATWQYLGTFTFDSQNAAVVVSNKSNEKGLVTSDAVRFGGGMGIVARRPSEAIAKNIISGMPDNSVIDPIKPDDFRWKKSGLPSYLEGARYYLQAAGIPDSIYSRSKYLNDYTDDYQSRPHWVNYLKKGGIPIDLSLAFHTDAGITPNDSIVGTLAIYSTKGEKFSDGRSKSISANLCRLIQNQICSDIQRSYNSKWTKRALKDAAYSEAAAPDVPAMLLELLSHQNLADMVYSLDPRFRFTAARAIYKGITRFLNDTNAVIQPLAPNHFAIRRIDDKKILLSWRNTVDSLEQSANAVKYRIYIRKEDGGYSPAFIETTADSLIYELPKWGTQYGFKVTAVNDGGESFPTEELSACLFDKPGKPALLVNGFTRVSSPAFYDDGARAGFQWWQDEGVTDGIDMAFLGYQYNFERSNSWLDDDNSGWGSSGTEWWGRLTYGNSHNFTSLEGESYQKLQLSYVSSSKAAFEDHCDVSKYSLIEILFGEERNVKNFREERDSTAVFNSKIISKLDTAISRKIPLLLSGAYIGTDMVERKDSTALKFAENKLGFIWRANIGSRSGNVAATDIAQKHLKGEWHFAGASVEDNDEYPKIYRVEAPDAIEPARGAIRLLRYTDYTTCAGTLFSSKGTPVAVFGFPLETIKNAGSKVSFMAQILKTLGVYTPRK